MAIGRVDSQFDAPFSEANFAALCRLLLVGEFRRGFYFMLLTELTGFILGSELLSFGFSRVAFRLLCYEGCKQSSDLSDMAYCAALWLQELPMPIPPRHTGSPINFLSSLLKAFCLVIDGRNLCLIMSSNGWSRSAMSGMVLAKKVHLLAGPCVNAV